MRGRQRRLGLILVASLVVILAGALAGTSTADTGTVTGTKKLDQTAIACTGTVKVTIALTGESSIVGDPEDIVLVLDRSGSMAGSFAVLQQNAKDFIDILDAQTDGALDGAIGHGSRIGVVSFSDSATVDQTLTADAGAAKDAIDDLGIGGGTNHTAAITAAQGELGGSQPANTKDMIIFTDGQTTTGGDASPVAATARTAGTEIFTIGLGSGINTAELADWATDPDADHAFVAPTAGNLEDIFDTIGAAIAAPAATAVSVTDTLGADFRVVAGSVLATKGTAASGGGGTVVTWSGFDLGSEQATLTYTAQHVGTLGDLKQVSTVSYSDDQERDADDVGLANPSVFVSCSPADKIDDCTGGNCTTNGSLPDKGLDITSAASGVPSSSFLVQRSLGSTLAPCAGFTSLIGAPGVEIYTTNQIPDVLTIRFVISKETRKKFKIGIGHLRVCLETNLPFKMDNGKISPASPGGYAGLLPKKATKTDVPGYGSIASPYFTANGAAVGQAEVVVYVRKPYDPRPWCC